MGSPRVDVVFRLWQCDKENHGWCEGPPRPFPAKFRSAGRAFTFGKVSFKRKKNTAFRWGARAFTQDIGRYKRTSEACRRARSASRAKKTANKRI